MKYLTLAILFCLTGFVSSAQYIYYRQSKTSYIKETPRISEQVVASEPQLRPKAKPVEEPEVKKEEPKKVPPAEKVYKTYPDKCPGVAGAIPWCLSYVPELLIKILVDRYGGYLMTIKGIRQADGSTLYYCQICSDGVMRTEYAKEDGTAVIK